MTPEGIIAQSILLDPRYKKDGFMRDEEKYNKAYSIMLEVVITEQLIACDNENSNNQIESNNTVKVVNNRLWEEYDSVVRKKTIQFTPRQIAKRQLDNYIREENIDRHEDATAWWEKNKSIFLILYELAMKLLLIPESSVPCERIFLKTGHIATEKRNRLLPKKLERIVLVGHNYR